MDELNPYRPPINAPVSAPHVELASRWHRLGAACIDHALARSPALVVSLLSSANLAPPIRIENVRIVLWRAFPIAALRSVPVAGPWLWLLEVLPIFGNDRRCIHDMIAGTDVVKV